VKDTIGAGDSFTAAVTMGMLLGWDIDRISEVANRVAAFVCSCEGGTPQLPEELRRNFSTNIHADHASTR
jgi:fructokinase